MKVGKYLRVAFVAAVIAPLLGVASVGAVARTDGTLVDVATDGAQTLSTQAQKVTTTLQERLDQRKAALATKLTTAETTRLKARCQAAQTKLGTVSQAVQTAAASRTATYRNVHANLTSLVTKLNGQVDTTSLEAALATLKAKTDAFDTDVATYKQTAADLVAMDCVSDATAFKASLETVKTDQAKLATESAAIRTLIQETIKPLLQTIRTSLAAKAGSTN